MPQQNMSYAYMSPAYNQYGQPNFRSGRGRSNIVQQVTSRINQRIQNLKRRTFTLPRSLAGAIKNPFRTAFMLSALPISGTAGFATKIKNIYGATSRGISKALVNPFEGMGVKGAIVGYLKRAGYIGGATIAIPTLFSVTSGTKANYPTFKDVVRASLSGGLLSKPIAIATSILGFGTRAGITAKDVATDLMSRDIPMSPYIPSLPTPKTNGGGYHVEGSTYNLMTPAPINPSSPSISISGGGGGGGIPPELLLLLLGAGAGGYLIGRRKRRKKKKSKKRRY